MHALGALPFSDAVERPSPAFDRLIHWFSNGARVAEQRDKWHSIAHAAPQIAMIYPTRSELLLGVVTPTVTAGQRPFAFGVFVECADLTVRPFSAALPIAERGFFDDCAALAMACLTLPAGACPDGAQARARAEA
jgi:hypothetical protein